MSIALSVVRQVLKGARRFDLFTVGFVQKIGEGVRRPLAGISATGTRATGWTRPALSPTIT